MKRGQPVAEIYTWVDGSGREWLGAEHYRAWLKSVLDEEEAAPRSTMKRGRFIVGSGTESTVNLSKQQSLFKRLAGLPATEPAILEFVSRYGLLSHRPYVLSNTINSTPEGGSVEGALSFGEPFEKWDNAIREAAAALTLWRALSRGEAALRPLLAPAAGTTFSAGGVSYKFPGGVRHSVRACRKSNYKQAARNILWDWLHERIGEESPFAARSPFKMAASTFLRSSRCPAVGVEAACWWHFAASVTAHQEPEERVCEAPECNENIEHRRAGATTCSGACRIALQRFNAAAEKRTVTVHLSRDTYEYLAAQGDISAAIEKLAAQKGE